MFRANQHGNKGRQRQSQQPATGGAAHPGNKRTNEQLTAVTASQRRALLERFALEALRSYTRNQPDTDQLLRLIQLNTIRAMTSNAKCLELPVDWLICHAISPFGFTGPSQAAYNVANQPSPRSLAPTNLQLRIPHHPWIDLFPLPRMRDNLLAVTCASEILTEEEEEQLWADLVEWGSFGTEAAGLIVWGNPWDPRNWEATIPFLKRWGWVLHGCDEILDATNYWRHQRGERPLRFKS